MHLFFNQNDKLHILIRILHKYWTCFALSENVKVNTILFIWDMIWRKISMFWKGGGVHARNFVYRVILFLCSMFKDILKIVNKQSVTLTTE